MTDIYKQLWAKSDPFHPLWCHLLDIAAVAKALLPRFGGIDPLPEPWVLFFVAMHDIGKTDPYFQGKCPDLTKPLTDASYVVPSLEKTKGFRHELASADWIAEYLLDQGWSDVFATGIVMGALMGHHGDFAPDNCGRNGLQSKKWKRLVDELAAIVAGVIGLPDFTPPEDAEHASAAGLRLVGLIVLADWIASNDEQYNYTHLSELSKSATPGQYWEAAQAHALLSVKRLGLHDNGEPARVIIRFCDVWPKIEQMRPTQEALDAAMQCGIAPGLAIVEAPMGEGKTEAAIALGEHWNAILGQSGAYIALPTQATSNQMHSRYEDFIAEFRPGDEPLLVHGMSWLVTKDEPEGEIAKADPEEDERSLAREWFRSAKRALLAADAVGTVDQALMGALNVKHGFLRLYGLTHKVLIVDEVHAYDTYMSAILENLLRWCSALRIPVVLLSATLSSRQKARLVAAYTGRNVPPSSEIESYPLITIAPFDGAASTIPVKRDSSRARRVRLNKLPLLGSPPAEVARLALEQTAPGGCVCVLANTVRDAQAIFEALGTPDGVDCYLFHARSLAGKRNVIEKNILRLFGKVKDGVPNLDRPPRSVLVATQVVEQSLDLDFDVMISQIAPIDLLLQRLGRLWRHAWNERYGRDMPEMIVLTPPGGDLKFGATEKVYQPESLLRTFAILSDRDEIHIPDDLRPLVELCYGDAPISEKIIPVKETTMLIEIHILQNHAPSNLNRDDTGSPKECVFGGFKRARISSQCLKRSIRQSDIFQRELAGQLGQRTRRLPELVRARLEAEGLPSDLASVAALKATGFGTKDGKERPKGDDNTDLDTAQTMFLTEADIAAVVAVLKKAAEEAGNVKKFEGVKASDLQALAKSNGFRPISVDVALFGRMITSEAFRDVEASMQVAHALSTHKVDHEFDYFTAVDDLQVKGEDDAGADMIGDFEFNSSCYYKYFSLDVQALCRNLTGEGHGRRTVSDDDKAKSVEMAKKAVDAFLRGAVMSTPSGKQNSCAAHQLPSLILIEARPHRTPVSYANAFVEPAYAGKGTGLVVASLEKIGAHIQALTEGFDLEASPRLMLAPEHPEFRIHDVEPVPNLNTLCARLQEVVVYG